jgi:hypothetical protein
LSIILTVALFIVGIVGAIETQLYCFNTSYNSSINSTSGFCLNPTYPNARQLPIQQFNTAFGNKLFWIVLAFLVSCLFLIISYQINKKQRCLKIGLLLFSVLFAMGGFDYGAYQISYIYSPVLHGSYFSVFFYIALVFSVVITAALLISLIIDKHKRKS